MSASLAVLLLLVGVACADPAQQELTHRNTDFAARLFRAVSGRSDVNVCVSPLPLWAGLAALLAATGGATRQQLQQGLRLHGLDPSHLPAQFQTLQTSVQTLNLRQGLVLLPDQSLQVAQPFLDQLQQFGGDSQPLDYSAPQDALDTINRWARDQTGDQGQQLLSRLEPQTQLLLATTASYQARFLLAFNSSSTQDERFYVDRYHVVMVPMMLRAGKFFLAYDPELRCGVLQLRLADGAAILVALPDEDVDVGSVEEELRAETIQGWISKLKKTKLEVQMPRFLLERSYSLRDVLKTLDISQLFQDDADISGLGGAKGLRLTQVYHQAVISVDESSEDASSGGGASFSSLPPRLTINRPFLFIVYQESSGAPLLMGRVKDPSLK